MCVDPEGYVDKFYVTAKLVYIYPTTSDWIQKWMGSNSHSLFPHFLVVSLEDHVEARGFAAASSTADAR
jgi:hypothetical protein